MSRYKVVRFIYFSVIFLVVLRLFYWQIIRSDDLSAKADDQRLTSTHIGAPRGSILFSDETTLASVQPEYLVYVQPKLIKDKEQVANALAAEFYSLDQHPDITNDDQKNSAIKDLQNYILGRESQDLFWVSLSRTIPYSEMVKIQKMGLSGVGFQGSTGRFYPEGSSSAHLLGFVGSDAYGNQTGYFGLEGFYNGELKGKDGKLTEEKDAQGAPILIGNYASEAPVPGKTLVLNIDRSIQKIVEDNLKKGMDQYQSKGASAIVMDPKTGAVLAMASYPNYDPGDVLDYSKEWFKNSTIADSYEPGSTFKVLVMAAAINEGLVTPDTKCDSCSGPVSIGGYQIETWNNQYFPNTSMTDVIVHSDNTGMVFTAKKLGLDKMFQYIQNYGFGNVTGIDLQDEFSPDIRLKKDWHDIDLATSSFGQGISATELQMVTAISSIANGGKLMQPEVVAEIKSDDGQVYKISPKTVRQVITPKTANTIKDMMVTAVDKGEAQWYKQHGGVGDFKIAGKTGTAQIPVAGHYDPTKTIASFIGFAPADDPKFIMIVRYDQPTASIYGAETAAPTFFSVAKQLFNYYGIAPDEVPSPSPSPN